MNLLTALGSLPRISRITICRSGRMDGAVAGAQNSSPSCNSASALLSVSRSLTSSKLFGKAIPRRSGLEGMLMRAWPLIAVAAAAGAVGMLPVLPGREDFRATSSSCSH